MPEEERRRFLRLSLDTEFEYVIMERAEGEHFTTGTKNISSGGVCIVVFEKLEQGAMLDLRFSIPTLKKFVLAKGRVAWIREMEFQGKTLHKPVFEAGIEFTEISTEDRKSINEYVISKE